MHLECGSEEIYPVPTLVSESPEEGSNRHLADPRLASTMGLVFVFGKHRNPTVILAMVPVIGQHSNWS